MQPSAYTIVPRGSIPIRDFTWGGAMEWVESQVSPDYRVICAYFINNFPEWQRAHPNQKFVRLKPDHEEPSSGQLYELQHKF